MAQDPFSPKDEVEKLQKEISRLKSLLSTSSVSNSIAGAGFFALRIGKDAKISYINTEFAKYFGLSSSALVGQTVEVLSKLPHPELTAKILKAVHSVEREGQVFDEARDEDLRTYSLNVLQKEGIKDVVLKDISEEAKLKNYVNQYVSPHLLADLSPEELSTFKYPERRFMSVSFTDLRGFTAMSEKLSPEEVREVINAYLEEVIRAVDDNGDTVDKIVGDELMALYGAPRHYDNHAMRAIKTCWEQMLNLQETRNLFRAQGKEIPECGIGINTGEMVLGNIGGGSRQDYTVLGAAVNLGARLCSHAAPSQILCSQMTLDAALKQLPASWDSIALEEEVDEPLRDGTMLRGKCRVVRVGENVALDPRKAEYKFIQLPAIKVKGVDELVKIYSVSGQRKKGLTGLRHDVVQKESYLRIFGEFRLVRELGRGGMGQVYLGKDSFGNSLAIKMLLAGNGASESQLTRFAREAKIMAQLNHRNICRIIKVGEVDRTKFIAMEYVDGPCLSDLIGEKGLDLEKLYAHQTKHSSSTSGKMHYSAKKAYKEKELIQFTLNFFLELLTGLSYAHQHGVLHRDLKPGNVMCRREGDPVMMDFGLARFDSDKNETDVSVTGQMVGTIDYVAPEQAAGDKQVDFRADVYSAAAILYVMLTGRKHFETSGNILSDIHALKDHRPLLPSRHRSSLGDDLDVILIKALDPEPQQRYADPEELMGDIKATLEGRPIMARRENSLDKGWRLVKRHKALSSTIAASTLVISFLFFTHVVKMSQALNEFRKMEALALAEQAKTEKSLQQLRISLAKTIEQKDWVQCKDLAYKILSYDRKDEKALDIIQRSDFEVLNEAQPIIEHPASGFEPRIEGLKATIQLWTNLVNQGNPYAKERVDALNLQLSSELEMVPNLKKLLAEFNLQKDTFGYFFTHSGGMSFRYIPPGRFKMGDEVSEPIHDVLLKRGFFISETEVTQAAWLKLLDVNPSKGKNNPKLPVTHVSWSDALMYCNALNEEMGYQTIEEDSITRIHLGLILNRRGFRLPTEAEWEYACRADLPNKHHFWWEVLKSSYSGSVPPLWYNATSGATTEDRQIRPVGEYPPNPWGLKDMHGNVSEWVLDTYDEDFYRMSAVNNPVCTKSQGPGVIRGGSVDNSLFLCRNGGRTSIDNTLTHGRIGFRVYFSP